jgi:beta-galactosidase GanA
MYNALGGFFRLFCTRERFHMRCSSVGLKLAAAGALLSSMVVCGISARAQEAPLPKLVTEQGRATLMVDGQPYFLLGAQVNNSSGWPEQLAADWPAAQAMRLNTLEVPVYWEQMEPVRGQFDFSVVDATLEQARAHKVHLVLLWFGTWKNGKMHYVPDWVKSDTATYPRMKGRDGMPIDVLSPNAAANLAADSSAFAALMRHIKQVDAQHTVILMQVENESGSLGLVRDFSPMAQAIFDAPVPAELVKALGKQPGTWSQVFGEDADESFAAWSVARYINAVAAAGKKELALPMYVNNWLKSPRAYTVSTAAGDDYPSGGPTINMHPIWKATAPAIDILAPDIYVASSERYRAVMHEFHTANNPLLIPESLGFGGFPGASNYARNLFYALGDGAVGFANFGLDAMRVDEPMNAESQAQVEGYRLLGSFDRELAALKFAGKLKTAVQEEGIGQQELEFGGAGEPTWHAEVLFPNFTNLQALHEGRAVVASLGANEFLVAGIDCRVEFALPVHSGGKQPQILRVEEGTYDGMRWVPVRVWNGDETDYGLNFGNKGLLLHVTLGSY